MSNHVYEWLSAYLDGELKGQATSTGGGASVRM